MISRNFTRKNERLRVDEFDGVNLLYYGFIKTALNRGGSYIEYPK